MSIDWSRVMPVIISICVIISVAVLRQYSKAVAAIAAVMPINIPLAMWIVYGGAEEGKRQDVLTTFSSELAINLVPTFVFALVAWQMVKAGYGLLPSIIVGYIAWGIGLGLIFFIRSQLGQAT